MKKFFLSCLFLITSFFAFAEDDFFCVPTNIDMLTCALYLQEEGLELQKFSDNKVILTGKLALNDNIATARLVSAEFDEDEILKNIFLVVEIENPVTLINYMKQNFNLTLVNFYSENGRAVLEYYTSENNIVEVGFYKDDKSLCVCYSKN